MIMREFPSSGIRDIIILRSEFFTARVGIPPSGVRGLKRFTQTNSSTKNRTTIVFYFGSQLQIQIDPVP